MTTGGITYVSDGPESFDFQKFVYRRLTTPSIQSKILRQKDKRVQISEGVAEAEIPGEWKTFSTLRAAEAFCDAWADDLEDQGWYLIHWLKQQSRPPYVQESIVIAPRRLDVRNGFPLRTGEGRNLIHAAGNGDVEGLKRFLNEPQEPLSLYLALASAVGYEHLEAVQLLVDAGADIHANTQSSHGHSVLAVALASGHFEIARFLADRGAVLKQPMPEDIRLQWQLYDAAEEADLDTMAELLAQGVDPGRVRGELESCLEAAVYGGSPRAVQMLLDAGADPDACLDSPLGFAASCGEIELMGLLLDAGADIDSDRSDEGTALCRAAEEGAAEAVAFLLGRNASVDIGRPLQEAAAEGHLTACRALWPHVDDRARSEAEAMLKKDGLLEVFELMLNDRSTTSSP